MPVPLDFEAPKRMKLAYSVQPVVHFEAGVIELHATINGLKDTWAREVLRTKEAAVRAGLIALGWTPPPDAEG